MERSQFHAGNSCESPACQGNSNAGPNCTAFNASPPYRLRSKRTVVFKLLEYEKDGGHIVCSIWWDKYSLEADSPFPEQWHPAQHYTSKVIMFFNRGTPSMLLLDHLADMVI
ncbi:hypothetical protein V6N11_045733 [Hibiscus sabdariffa]|uniref:Uncharacterized protein n=1 Tax=Hibiscus sabdariffa TaxID=183260 RepID=A0ABR2Q1U2_9ROSI